MSRHFRTIRRQLRVMLQPALQGPQVLAFLPAMTLAAYWVFGETALLTVAVIVPLLLAFADVTPADAGGSAALKDSVTGLANRSALTGKLDHAMTTAGKSGMTTACLAITLDDFSQVQDRFDTAKTDRILQQVGDRLTLVCREKDTVARLQGASFGISLKPIARADLETIIQLCGRIQTAIAEPISLDGVTVYITASVGFCLASRSPEPTGKSILESAESAMIEARRNGPGAIRAFSAQMKSLLVRRSAQLEEISTALERGQIRPWFQPQISTDTGQLTGFEALARWIHPERGVIPPPEFLSALEATGQMERLCEVVLFHALTALRSWDQAGLVVPTVGVNFSGINLQNPKVVDKLRWELDRFSLAPERLAIEVLETVVTDSDNDIVTHNIAAISKLGCRIDLDDFGTGNASIRHLRRFAVNRIKIDRSFVSKVDRDQDQQRMIAAILTMAEQLQIETLAEGVETTGEHAMLAQLGCNHVQGFAIARPIPFEETIGWYEQHNRKISAAPKIRKKSK